jgi:hypothetical protein
MTKKNSPSILNLSSSTNNIKKKQAEFRKNAFKKIDIMKKQSKHKKPTQPRDDLSECSFSSCSTIKSDLSAKSSSSCFFPHPKPWNSDTHHYDKSRTKRIPEHTVGISKEEINKINQKR